MIFITGPRIFAAQITGGRRNNNQYLVIKNSGVLWDVSDKKPLKVQ